MTQVIKISILIKKRKLLMSKSKKDSNKEKDKEKELTALFHKCYITIKDKIKCKSNI